MTDKTDILSLTLAELTEEVTGKLGEKKFRAGQIYDWLHVKKVKSFDEMTNIKKEMLVNLKKDYSIDHLKIVDVQEDEDVCKYLFESSLVLIIYTSYKNYLYKSTPIPYLLNLKIFQY